jgi:hypothetical protein
MYYNASSAPIGHPQTTQTTIYRTVTLRPSPTASVNGNQSLFNTYASCRRGVYANPSG